MRKPYSGPARCHQNQRICTTVERIDGQIRIGTTRNDTHLDLPQAAFEIVLEKLADAVRAGFRRPGQRVRVAETQVDVVVTDESKILLATEGLSVELHLGEVGGLLTHGRDWLDSEESHQGQATLHDEWELARVDVLVG